MGEKRYKKHYISGGFLADLTNWKWRILVDFNIRSGGFEKNLSVNAAMATLSGMSISPREISPLVQKSGDGNGI
jgi:hypothetical protein